MDKFKNEQERGGGIDYGNIFLLSAVALFIIFAAFQGGMIATVQEVAGNFADNFESLRVADTGRPNI